MSRTVLALVAALLAGVPALTADAASAAPANRDAPVITGDLPSASGIFIDFGELESLGSRAARRPGCPSTC